MICRPCYEKLLIRYKVEEATWLPDELVACTLKCHKSAIAPEPDEAAASKRHGRGDSWDTDGKDGSFERSSEAILIDWLRTPGNYDRWRGNDYGQTKVAIQQSVADLINEAGMREFQIDRERTAKGVGSKIQYMEYLFRKCFSFINDTGQGIMAEQGLSENDPKFMSYVKQKWEHYYDLEAIMKERSGNRVVSEFNFDVS